MASNYRPRSTRGLNDYQYSNRTFSPTGSILVDKNIFTCRRDELRKLIPIQHGSSERDPHSCRSLLWQADHLCRWLRVAVCGLECTVRTFRGSLLKLNLNQRICLNCPGCSHRSSRCSPDFHAYFRETKPKAIVRRVIKFKADNIRMPLFDNYKFLQYFFNITFC